MVRTKHSGVWSSIMTFFPVGFRTPIDENGCTDILQIKIVSVCCQSVQMRSSSNTLSDVQASLSTVKVHINYSLNWTHMVAQEGLMSRRQAHHLLGLFSWCRESNPLKIQSQWRKSVSTQTHQCWLFNKSVQRRWVCAGNEFFGRFSRQHWVEEEHYYNNSASCSQVFNKTQHCFWKDQP